MGNRLTQRAPLESLNSGDIADSQNKRCNGRFWVHSRPIFDEEALRVHLLGTIAKVGDQSGYAPPNEGRTSFAAVTRR
jgi:hypothetical protein